MTFELTDEWLADLLDDEEEEVYDPFLYILGLDPGGTTGVAMLRINQDDDELNPELVYLHQLPDGRYGFKNWFGGSRVSDNLIIVSEKWRERNIKGANREPQYIEGVMHMLWDDDNIEYQYPDQKELIPDEWLKENNLWVEGMRHEMDALKHAFAYLRNQEHSATLKSLMGGDDEDGEGGDTEPMAQPGDAERAQLGDSGDPAGAVDPDADADADADAGEGEGEGDGTPADFQELIDAIGQGGGGDGESSDEAPEPTGSGGRGAEVDADSLKEKDYKATERELNGAFTGFNPADEGTQKVLFED